MRAEAIFGVATRIGPQRYPSAGAAQMSLIAELKRRNVFRVGVAYAIVSWLALQLEQLRRMEQGGELAAHPATQLVRVREVE